MGIQSTVDISRSGAITRIKTIIDLCEAKDYRAIEQFSFEDHKSHLVEHFVDTFTAPFNYDVIDKWTNSMLERMMDRPFFRLSPFDNYRVTEE